MTDPIFELHQLLLAGRYIEATDVAANRVRGSWSEKGLHLAALLYERLLRPADAIDVWLEFNEQFPTDPRGAIGLARNLRRIGDGPASLRLLRVWRDRLSHERRARVLLDAGAEYVQLKRPNEAGQFLATPAMQDRMVVDGLKVMAHCAVLKKQHVAAAALLDAHDKLFQVPSPPGTTIVSYPKVGVTWLSFLVSQAILNGFKLPRSRPTIFFNALLQEAGVDLHISRSHDDAGITTEIGDDCNVEAVFLHSARERFRGKRVLLLIRDPRDVVVSFYHQLTRRTLGKPLQLSMHDFIHDPVLGIQRVVQFHSIWARTLPILQDLLIVRYEDLLTDTANELQSVLQFLLIPGVDRTAIESAVEAGSANNLRDLERRGLVDGMIVFNDNDGAGLKVRKAASGSAATELKPEDLAFLNTTLEEACATDTALCALWHSYLQ